MTRSPRASPVLRTLRWLLRAVLLLVALAALVVIFGLGPFMLQDEPLLKSSAPPSAEDVAATRQLVRDLRRAAGNPETPASVLQTDEDQLNSAMRLGTRFAEGLRGQITVSPDYVTGRISVPVPWPGRRKWLNVTARVPGFTGPFRLSRVTVGALHVPPDLALWVARQGANLIMGNGFGDKVVQAATEMQISGRTLRFRIALDEVGKNGVMRGAFGTLRGRDMPSPELIEGYHRRIRAAMADGTLQQSGSFLPYLKFALHAAYQDSTAGHLPNAYTAAIFGLAKVCGARDFALIVGRLAFDRAEAGRDWPTSCAEVTFNGRTDSRRHFLTSAALQAASNTGVAVSIGEFKELYDTISGAGGFDFTDMAANLSGVRLSNVLMAAPPKDWPALLALIGTENDVIIPYDGIPALMPEAAFKARFGDVDSPAYHAMIARIEDRIDTLRPYRGR